MPALTSPPDPSAAGAAARAGDPRRDAILAAARHVCLTRGVAAVRMEEIAAAAHVSKGTLYNHFESKHQLLLEMVLAQFRAGDRVMETVVSQPGSAAESLERLFDELAHLLDVQTSNATLLFQAWAIVAHEADLREPLDRALREIFNTWSAETRAIVEQGQADGTFNAAADAGAIGDAITGLVSGYLFRATFDPKAANGRALRRAFHLLVAEKLLPLEASEGESK
jgi:TetR/AcrR family transcriptional repressor of nem operon